MRYTNCPFCNDYHEFNIEHFNIKCFCGAYIYAFHPGNEVIWKKGGHKLSTPFFRKRKHETD